MISLRRVAAAALVLAPLTSGAALASSPGGSTESNNQVNCTTRDGQGFWAEAGAAVVYAGAQGASVCNSGRGVQGRVLVSTEGWAAVDGDADNSPDEADGYVRAGADGVHCGNASNEDSANPNQTGNPCP